MYFLFIIWGNFRTVLIQYALSYPYIRRRHWDLANVLVCAYIPRNTLGSRGAKEISGEQGNRRTRIDSG
jgi:hypothetical protein